MCSLDSMIVSQELRNAPNIRESPGVKTPSENTLGLLFNYLKEGLRDLGGISDWAAKVFFSLAALACSCCLVVVATFFLISRCSSVVLSMFYFVWLCDTLMFTSIRKPDRSPRPTEFPNPPATKIKSPKPLISLRIP